MPDRPLPAPDPPPAPADSTASSERAERYAQSALAPATRRAYEQRLAGVRQLVRRARRAGDPGDAGDASRRSWPPRPTAGSGRSRSGAARRRSPPRTAPRTTRTRATPAPSPRSCPGSAASTAPRPRAGPRRSTSTRSRGCSSRSTPPRSPAGATGRCCCSGSPPRCAARSSSRSTSRTSSSTPRRGLLVTIRGIQDRPGAGRSQVAVPYARAGDDRCAVRALQAWLAGRRDPPRPGVPADAPRRHAHRPSGSQTSPSR